MALRERLLDSDPPDLHKRSSHYCWVWSHWSFRLVPYSFQSGSPEPFYPQWAPRGVVELATGVSRHPSLSRCTPSAGRKKLQLWQVGGVGWELGHPIGSSAPPWQLWMGQFIVICKCLNCGTVLRWCSTEEGGMLSFKPQWIWHGLMLELSFETLVPTYLWVCFGLFYLIKVGGGNALGIYSLLCLSTVLSGVSPLEKGRIRLSIMGCDTIKCMTVWGLKCWNVSAWSLPAISVTGPRHVLLLVGQ